MKTRKEVTDYYEQILRRQGYRPSDKPGMADVWSNGSFETISLSEEVDDFIEQEIAAGHMEPGA